MKNAVIVSAIFFILISGAIVPTAHADIAWTLLDQFKLDAEPIDITVSADGKLIFVLVPGEILVYSNIEKKAANRIPIDDAFDKLSYSQKNNVLILTSSSSKILKRIKIDVVHEIDISGLPYKGPDNAPVIIAVFDDYQCPYCARLHSILKQVLGKYPDKVKLVIKQFPIRSHKFAKKAARAALAANEQGKFWEFHDKLFKSYRSLNDAKFLSFAKELNLDMEKFTAGMNSEAIKNVIQKDIINGKKIGVRGTPSVYINGKVLKSRSLKGFQQIIENELKKRSLK